MILDLRLVFLHNSSYTYKFYSFFHESTEAKTRNTRACFTQIEKTEMKKTTTTSFLRTYQFGEEEVEDEAVAATEARTQ